MTDQWRMDCTNTYCKEPTDETRRINMTNFPDELWATFEEVQTLYKINGDSNLYKQKRYINEDLVPVSCGGTMEPVVTSGYSVVKAPGHKWVQESLAGGTMDENDSNALARAFYDPANDEMTVAEFTEKYKHLNPALQDRLERDGIQRQSDAADIAGLNALEEGEDHGI